MIVAGAPVQHRTDAERFAEDMTHHVLRPHTLSRTLVMRAPRGMDVMVARVPPVRRRINPSAQSKVQRGGRLVDGYRSRFRNVFGTTPARDGKFAGRKPDRLTVCPIYLLLEKEIRSEALRSRGIHATEFVFHDKRRHARPPVLVANAQRHITRLCDIEEHGGAVAESDVLGAGTQRRPDLRLTPSAVAAVEQHNPVFELQTGKLRLHRLLPVGVEIEPSIGHVRRPDRLRSHGEPCPAAVNRSRLRALQAEHARHTSFIAHFHEIRTPALLDQSRRRGGPVHRDPALGIDANGQQTARIQNLLDLLNGTRSIRHAGSRGNPLPVRITERLPQIRHGVDQPADLRDERLRLDRRDESLAQRWANTTNPKIEPRRRRRLSAVSTESSSLSSG